MAAPLTRRKAMRRSIACAARWGAAAHVSAATPTAASSPCHTNAVRRPAELYRSCRERFGGLLACGASLDGRNGLHQAQCTAVIVIDFLCTASDATINEGHTSGPASDRRAERTCSYRSRAVIMCVKLLAPAFNRPLGAFPFECFCIIC